MITKIKQFFSEHTVLIIAIVATIFSIVSFLYFYNAGLITAYGDSRGHLNIARRVVDSLTPGVAQFGGYWLPLLHILMIPFIWNDFMWQSGIAGSIPSMIAFVLTVVFIYKLVLYITKDKFSAIIASLIILTNINLLYMQVAPMTESLFICTIVIFVYFFYKWFREKNIIDLILASIFLVLSSLNRYEGWGLVFASVALLILYWMQNKFSKKIEGVLVMFATLSFTGIILWLLWGATIFHDPLEFMHNPLNISNQAGMNDNWIGLHNIRDSVLVNAYAVLHTSGFLLVGIFLVGIVVFLVQKNRSVYKSKNLLLFLLITPFLFDVLMVYLGKVPIEVPELSKAYNYFNIRYSLFSLPIIAVVISLISKRRVIKIGIFILIICNFLFVALYKDESIVVLKDVGVADNRYNSATEWFKYNYDEKLILISGAYDSLMFKWGFSQKNFISEGSYGYWDESLKDPSKYATWVFISANDNNPRDSLAKNINKDSLYKNFKLEYQDDKVIILKKIVSVTE